jgi:hypothetical protein
VTQSRTFNFRGAAAFAAAMLAGLALQSARFAEGKGAGDGRSHCRTTSNGSIKVRRAAVKTRNRARNRRAHK